MARQIIYSIIVALLAGGLFFQHHRHQQEQRRIWVKLRLLNASLLVANEQNEEAARRSARETESLVRRIGSQQQGVRVVKQNEEILRRTTQVVGVLRNMRSRLLHILPRVEHLSDLASNKGGVAAVLADSTGGASVHRQLADYTAFIRQFLPELPLLQARQARDPVLKEALADAGGAGQFYYDQASFSEALVMLTQQETAVWAYATAALGNQSLKVTYCGVLDKVRARVMTVADTVAAGEKYRAALFLGALQDYRDLRMSVNGKAISVLPNGEGRVEFIVPKSGAAPGVSPTFWRGAIQTSMYGRDSTFEVLVRYFVRHN
ncbi:hypothetical protein [Hymenobacter properus]|uniref:Gliding motility-associated protein GldM first immunoglobulin-like domain-containing protein n=1 Tax=Hymenobacter properus TaxID=2791026 RepID=A0A931BFM7_9BACT|nr:hypothetical protein [Hymenobacter properus]MBF9142579.1 hypothetical protein [Hymenobacter properus]MBR7721387.1 hypothetical protein [Microvirga sp. SRT04]